ncbi:sugar transferase [Actinomadura spongiicola]|uniref:Sugar transferase n=1 Tax=Actinomadura spongiicola TaxID=2303421 RepID=A0A372GN73_9ACTN|nr:sugar transferase [Actinomadura spongiicola]RFS86529.1 sugar transferase [Actinomadura spongiicola]
MSKDFTARPIDPSDGIPPSRGRRALDIVAALTGLLLLSVPMLLIYALVRLTSRGRGIFKQTRVGQGGRPFTMYKFRTMRQGVGGMKVTATSDPRVTPLGRFLRRYYLDELPQLVNVLRGDMTLVGARPETYDLAVYYDARWRWIFDHRPGITGLSQVSFRYAEILPPGQEVDLAFYVEHLAPAQSAADAVYLSNPSMRVTLRVLLRTVRYILGFKVPQLPVSGTGNVAELTSPSDAAHRAKEPGSAA